MADQTLNDSDYRTFVRLTDIAGRYGGAEGLQNKINKLEEDAATFRTKSKDLEKLVPAEGSKVLTAEEVKRWDAFQALGQTPEELAAGKVLTADEAKEQEAFTALGVKAADVAAIVTERDALKSKDAKRSRKDSISLLVKAEKLPDEAADTIADLGSLSEATFEVKSEKNKDASGKDVTIEVGYVTLPGQQPVKFSEYREQNAVLKGIRTGAGANEEKDKGSGNGWLPQETRGATGARTPGEHAKAVATQLDYSV
jgi:hypothetical protein